MVRSSLRLMLVDGINHIGMLTNDTDGFHALFREVFDAEVFADMRTEEGRVSAVTIGPKTQLNVFELDGNTEAERQRPMYGRGRLDHSGPEDANPPGTPADGYERVR